MMVSAELRVSKSHKYTGDKLKVAEFRENIV